MQIRKLVRFLAKVHEPCCFDPPLSEALAGKIQSIRESRSEDIGAHSRKSNGGKGRWKGFNPCTSIPTFFQICLPVYATIRKNEIRKIACSYTARLSVAIDFFMFDVLGGHEFLEISKLLRRRFSRPLHYVGR